METTNPLILGALAELHRNGYAASSHSTRDDCVVVNDPVRDYSTDGPKVTYEPRTVHIRQIRRFINDRS